MEDNLIRALSVPSWVKLGDEEVYNQNIPWYNCIKDICAHLQPKKVVEFGTRAGYSAYTVHQICPEAKIWSYEGDCDEVSKGYWKHAEKIVPGILILHFNTNDLIGIPICDLVLADADHTFNGCLHELSMSAWYTNNILVDDYGEEIQVKQAVQQFLECHNWRLEELRYGEKVMAYLRNNT